MYGRDQHTATQTPATAKGNKKDVYMRFPYDDVPDFCCPFYLRFIILLKKKK